MIFSIAPMYVLLRCRHDVKIRILGPVQGESTPADELS